MPSEIPSAGKGREGAETSCEFYTNRIAAWNRLHRSVRSSRADNASVNGRDIVSTFPAFTRAIVIMSLFAAADGIRSSESRPWRSVDNSATVEQRLQLKGGEMNAR